jgi:hypothetical protein
MPQPFFIASHPIPHACTHTQIHKTQVSRRHRKPLPYVFLFVLSFVHPYNVASPNSCVLLSTRFFMIGYLGIGFEFAAELTYPIPEGISSGILMVASEIFGIAFTVGGGELLDRYGDLSANLALLGLLIVGLAMTTQINGTDLRRQAVTAGLENQTTCNNMSALKPSMIQNPSLCLTSHSIFPS